MVSLISDHLSRRRRDTHTHIQTHAQKCMGIFSLFFPFFCLCVTALATKIIHNENGNIGDIANTTKTLAPPPPSTAAGSKTAQFKPGIAVTVGIFTTIFSITFLLLLYLKHRKRGYSYSNSSRNNHPLSRKNSGVDRKIIESLPIFRFSSLRGQKDGLECAVCLNRFEPDEVLRLLPKCKHAFHVECVDIWLEAHSTCPLCRYRVDPEAVLFVDSKALYNYRDSNQVTPRNNSERGKGIEFTNGRISGRHSSAVEGGGSLEIIVENPLGEDRDTVRGRASLDSWNFGRRRVSGNKRRDFMRCKSLDSWKSRRNVDDPGKTAGVPVGRSRSCRRDGELPVQVEKHRLEHRIVISGGGDGAASEEEWRRRWSDVEASDMLYLRSEMILGGKEEERWSRNGVINGGSVSEITGVSRYRMSNSSSNGGWRDERERRHGEGVVKIWLSWISQYQQTTAVNSAATGCAVPSSSSTIVV
ncbi:hypothetical protein OROGR_016962 [Orobanche gracilis]